MVRIDFSWAIAQWRRAWTVDVKYIARASAFDAATPDLHSHLLLLGCLNTKALLKWSLVQKGEETPRREGFN